MVGRHFTKLSHANIDVESPSKTMIFCEFIRIYLMILTQKNISYDSPFMQLKFHVCRDFLMKLFAEESDTFSRVFQK